MNWLEFLANIFSTLVSAAWPIVAVIGVLSLRDRLGGLLEAVAEKLGGATSVTGPGNFSMQFAKEVGAVKRSAEKFEAASPSNGSTRQPNGAEDPAGTSGLSQGPGSAQHLRSGTMTIFLDRLEEISIVSPRAAIMEAFLFIETEAARVVEHYLPADQSRRFRGSPWRALRQVPDMPRDLVKTIDGLVRLRNEAAHTLDFSAEIETVREYGELSFTVAKRLQGFEGPDESDALFAELSVEGRPS